MKINNKGYPFIWLLIVILILAAHITYELMASNFQSSDPWFWVMSYTPYAIVIELGISIYLIRRKTLAGYVILLASVGNIFLNALAAVKF